jgi:acetyl esterase/lipase
VSSIIGFRPGTSYPIWQNAKREADENLVELIRAFRAWKSKWNWLSAHLPSMPAIRFVFALLSLLISTLVLFKVPDLFIWQLKVGATEYGHWFALMALVIAFAGRRQSALDSVSVLLAIASAVLFMSSSLRAANYAKTARERMDKVFPPVPNAPVAPDPFSLLKIWTIGGTKSVEVASLDYQEFAGQTLSLDIYPAVGQSGPGPCLVVIHGGGWDRGSRKEFASANHRLAQRGITVVAVDYRLAPGATWPAQGQDVQMAINFLKGQADGLAIDPKKFILMGRSAGGQIAEALAVSGTIPEVIGCIGLYTPADMHFAFKYADKKDILDSDKLLRQYLGGTPETARAAFDSASAYQRISRRTVPMLLMHGDNDELVWVQQSRRLAERLKENGVRHVYLELPWATHAFDHNDNGPGGQFALWAIERFVRSVAQ